MKQTIFHSYKLKMKIKTLLLVRLFIEGVQRNKKS